MSRFEDLYRQKLRTAAEAVADLADGSTLAVAMCAGQPPALLAAIAARVRARDLKRLVVYYKIAMAPLAETLLQEHVLQHLDARTFFVAGADHQAVKWQSATHDKRLSFVPVHFSQLPRLFTEHIAADAVVATVSPMDRHGYFSFGTNNDYITTAARRCGRLILEVNRAMPRVFGQSQVHVGEAAAVVENDAPLPAVAEAASTPESRAIGALIAPMVPNGATIQAGIGRIPGAVLATLSGHEALGIHTELLSPGFVPLIDSGVANGARKTLHPRKAVFTVALGDAPFYAWMDDHAGLESHPSSYVNDLRIIAGHDDFISINTAIEIDLYGQVNAEFIGEHEYSGSGGQFDFVKGSSLSRGGKSIIALQSTARGGTVSAIVPRVGMVTDPRMDVEYVVTEHGAANLRGKSTRQRAEALIAIAHPDHRAALLAAARSVTLV